ncbi:MAG: hypothetical protein ACRECR_05930, partial [Thermoplasmata archaeon]
MTEPQLPANPSPHSPTGTGRHHLGGARSLGFAVLSVSDTHTEEDDPSGACVLERLRGAGHRVLHYG